MTKVVADCLCEAMDSLGIDYSRHDGYSGRGMYGKSTASVSVNNISDVVAAAAECGYELGKDRSQMLSIDEFVLAMQNLSTDSMGMGIVVY